MDETQYTILVTGASGFIGSRFLRHLHKKRKASGPPFKEKDYPKPKREEASSSSPPPEASTFESSLDPYRLIAFLRSSSQVEEKIPPGVECRYGSLEDEKSVRKAVQGVDVVLHLAAMMDFYPKQVQQVYRTNVDGTRYLLEGFVEEVTRRRSESAHDPTSYTPRFIYVSSTEAIGAVKDGVGDEESELAPVYDYGKSKVMAEKLVKEICTANQIPYVILRPTGVLGPGDFFTIYELMEMVNLGLLCFIPGSGTAQLMYTHVDDVVEGLEKAVVVNSCLNETIILCPDEALTYKEWILLLSKKFHRQKPFLHLPLPVVKFATLLLGPIMNRGKNRTFMYQTNTIDRMVENRVYSNKKAKRILNWRPRYSLAEAIEQTVGYNLEKGILKRYPLSPFFLLSVCCVLCLLVLGFLIRTLF